MDTMMNTIGWNIGFITLWGLHVLSVIAFFTGLLLFIVLAIKKFNETQLKQWAIGLMITGTLVCLFTIGMIGRPWIKLDSYGGSHVKGMPMQQMQMMEHMMEEMTEHDRGMGGNDKEEHGNMMQMMRMMMNAPRGNGLDAIQDQNNESSDSSI